MSLIGKFVKAKLTLGIPHHHISVVVESELKLFPAYGLFQMRGPEVIKIVYEITWEETSVAVIVFRTVTFR